MTDKEEVARLLNTIFGPRNRDVLCPNNSPEPHNLGEFPLTCHQCRIEADS